MRLPFRVERDQGVCRYDRWMPTLPAAEGPRPYASLSGLRCIGSERRLRTRSHTRASVPVPVPVPVAVSYQTPAAWIHCREMERWVASHQAQRLAVRHACHAMRAWLAVRVDVARLATTCCPRETAQPTHKRAERTHASQWNLGHKFVMLKQVRRSE